MSSFQPRDQDILLQLENDRSLDIDEIELVINEVKHEFNKFHQELARREAEIVGEINKIREKIVETFVQRKNSLFETNNSREIEHEFGVSTRVNIFWKKGGLKINDICEIQTSQRRKSNSIYHITNPYGDLTKLLFTARSSQSLLPAIDINFPSEMHLAAKQLINTSQPKYPILPIHELILHNLRNNKNIVDIQDGLYSLSKYAICLFFDPSRSIFHTIQTQSCYHRTLITSKIEDFEIVLHKMDFQYSHSTQLYTINHLLLAAPQYIDKLASICCELLLAVEELIYFQDFQNSVDPLTYFSSPILPHELIMNPSICPITDAVDVCASSRDASLISPHNLSLENLQQTINQRPRSKAVNSDVDTPNSSLSDTQYHSRTSNCSGELFQSRAYDPPKDLYESIPHVPPSPIIVENKFISHAFAKVGETNLFSFSDCGNNDMAASYRARVGSNERSMTQSVQPMPQSPVDTSLNTRQCPKCFKETAKCFQVCQFCRTYIP